MSYKELAAYRIWLQNKLTAQTARQYYATVEKMVLHLGRPVKDINLTDVTLYVDELYKHYTNESVVKYADRIRSFLRFIEKDSIAYKLPVRKTIVSPEDPDSLDIIEFFPEEKIKVLLSVARHPAELAALQMAYHFAMRVNEVPLLKTSWINLDERTMKIYRLKSKVPWQDLPFDHEDTDIHDTFGVVRSWLIFRNDRTSDHLILPVKYTPNQTISFNALEQFFHRTVQQAAKVDSFFQKVIEQKASFHILRHSKGTNMIIHQLKTGNGVSLLKVTKWLHHASYDTTLRYIHLAARYLGMPDIPISAQL